MSPRESPPDPIAATGAAPASPGAVRRLAWRVFARLPRPVRLGLVHTFTPDYTVGALCFLEHGTLEDGGQVLVLRQRHRRGWTLPGGLLDRHEDPATAVQREVREEIGLHIDPGEPVTVVIDPDERRVDVIFVVPITVRPQVHPQGEAIAARWLTRAELGTVDVSTAQAFGALARSRTGGAGPGRVLDEG
ncbi:MAG: NUDIX hydrolase [Kineosporiaceae bacterium]